MKILRDSAVVLVSALLTAVLSGAALRPAAIRAEGEEEVALALLAGSRPIEAEGLTLTLAFEKESYDAGAKPVVTLVARNDSDERRCTKGRVRVLSQPQTSIYSRIMVLPKEVFAKDVELDVPAKGEAKIELETTVVAEAGASLSLTVQLGEKQWPGGAASVKAPPPPVQSPPAQQKKQADEPEAAEVARR